MKKVFIVLCIISTIASCKNEPATPPSAVLDGMFSAMQQGNLEEMKSFITKTDVAMLDAAEQIMTKVDPEGIKKIKDRITDELKENAGKIQYNFKKEMVDGDRATVEAEIVFNPAATDSTRRSTLQTFELVKEGDAWKIALSKPGNEMFNSMKGNMGPRKGDLKDGVEQLKKMDKDSLKMLISKGLQALDSLDKKK